MDAAGAPGTYEVTGFDFQATSTLTGQLYESRGSLVFPTGVGVGRFWYRGAAVDSFPLPVQTYPTVFIDQIVGRLDRSGQVTLTFSYSGADGSGSVSLVTD